MKLDMQGKVMWEQKDKGRTFSMRLDSLLTSCVSFCRFASTDESWLMGGEPGEGADGGKETKSPQEDEEQITASSEDQGMHLSVSKMTRAITL